MESEPHSGMTAEEHACFGACLAAAGLDVGWNTSQNDRDDDNDMDLDE